MKKILVLFFVSVMVLVGSLGFSTNAKAMSVIDPGVSPIGCCSNLAFSDSLGAWVLAIPCLAFQGRNYSLQLVFNPATGGFEIYPGVAYADGSCANGGGVAGCSDCSCPEYASAHPSECGATGALNFRLTWNDQNDVDIHVTYNNSEEIYYSNKHGSTTGGTLDVDANAGCSSNITSHGVENIVYDNPPAGTYVLKICGYEHCSGQPASTTVRAQALRGGAVVFDQNISISNWNDDCVDNVVSIQVQ